MNLYIKKVRVVVTLEMIKRELTNLAVMGRDLPKDSDLYKLIESSKLSPMYEYIDQLQAKFDRLAIPKETIESAPADYPKS